MSSQLKVSIGQHSDKGRKQVNQDFHGAVLPLEPQLSSKGVALALADGISSSEVSQVASEASVASFLADYFCTSETWSVKKSAQRVLSAINAWLHSQTRHSQYRYDMDRGYVCTFSALVLKSSTAYLFHVGDTRVYRLRDERLEQLSADHRLWISREQSYLSRALGINPHLEIDYQALPLERGDLFLLATDGVYEHLDAQWMVEAVQAHPDDLDAAARAMVAEAFGRGSDDNLTIQLLRVDALPDRGADELQQQLRELPPPPLLQARSELDGYRIVRQLHASSRSHVYLATDGADATPVVIKTPSIEQGQDAAYLERFLMEEWIARRIDSPHVLKAREQTRRRRYLYSVSEFVEGQTLAQWMIDNPRPSLETVRGLAEQIGKGLRAFHRLEMLHQDLRPANLMIDASGTLKIIDFGSTRVAGLTELAAPGSRDELLGTAAYTAPEYFLGETGSVRSDVFSLAVICYQMLGGKLPYGTRVAATRSRAAQARLHYQPLRDDDRNLPAWIDEVLRKALQPDPNRRYQDVAEFTHALRHPSQEFLSRNRAPLIERNPVLFWKSLSLALGVAVLALLLD